MVEGYEGTLKLGEAPREVLGLHDEMGEVFLDNADDVIEESTSQHEAVRSVMCCSPVERIIDKLIERTKAMFCP